VCSCESGLAIASRARLLAKAATRDCNNMTCRLFHLTIDEREVRKDTEAGCEELATSSAGTSS
jgi:hypothetical protein